MRYRLVALTVESSVMLLRHLGNFDWDEIVILTANGYKTMAVRELPEHFNGSVPVGRLRPVYFWGGPMVAKQFEGDYMTFIIDRAIYVMCEKGWAHVNATIAYCEGLSKGAKCTQKA